MKFVDTRLPKLCHAKPGDIVRLENGLHMVCAFPVKGKRAARPMMMHGLYDDERPLFLVNMASGEAVVMPHLSTRLEIVHDVTLVDGPMP